MPDFPTVPQADAVAMAAVAALKRREPAALTTDDLDLLLAASQRNNDMEARELSLEALDARVAAAPADAAELAALVQTALTAAHLTGDAARRTQATALVERLATATADNASGRAAAALLQASWVLDEGRWRDAALRALEEQPAQDVEVGRALLDAYEVIGRSSWLDASRALADDDKTFAGLDLRDRLRAAEWLARLGMATAGEEYQERARALLEAVKNAPGVQAGGALAAAFALACLRVAEEPVHIVIPGAPDDARTQALLWAALRVDHWHRLAQAADPQADAELLDALGYYAGPRPMAYVCYNLTCSQPLAEPKQIPEAVTRLAGAGSALAAFGDAKPAPGPAPFLTLGGGAGKGPMLNFGMGMGGAGTEAKDEGER